MDKKVDLKLVALMGVIMIFTIILIMSYQFKANAISISSVGVIIIEIGVIICSIICALASGYIINKKEVKPEKALLYILPIFCIVLSAVIPVGRGHDEYNHWIKSYEVSVGEFFTPIVEGNSSANVPETILNVIVEKTKGVFKYSDNIGLLNVKLDESAKTKVQINNIATYCFVQYIPQAIGIAVGRIITKVPLLLAYFGRTFNFAVCITLMYFAIKNIPFGKNIMLALSILPITIEGFATLSSDGITIAIACFFISYVFKLMYDEKTKCGKKELLVLGVSGAILALCKFVYLPIVFLTILIPKVKFENNKERIISITLIVTIAVILNLLWLYIGSTSLVQLNPNATKYKFMQILTNPIEYVEKVIYTFTNNFDMYFESCFGGQLEWDEVVKMPIIPYITCAVMLIATMSEEKLKDIFDKKHIIVMMFIILAVAGLIFTSIFLQWTSDKIEINGVQGRYFLPILPLIMFLIGKIKIKTLYKTQNITKLICITGYIVMIYTAISTMAIHL